MPRHPISDAHEWINEIPTVPTHSLVKLQPSQRSWVYSCVNVILIRLESISFPGNSSFGLISLCHIKKFTVPFLFFFFIFYFFKFEHVDLFMCEGLKK